jgi:hypothetical protein
MSALPPEADIAEHSGNVRFVPKADIPCTARTTVVDRDQGICLPKTQQ